MQPASYDSMWCVAGVLSGIPPLNVARPTALVSATEGKELDSLEPVEEEF